MKYIGGDLMKYIPNTRNPLVDLKSAAANLSNILLHIVRDGRSEFRNQKAIDLIADTDAILQQLESSGLESLETVEVGGLVLQVYAEQESDGIAVYEVYHHGTEIHTAISDEFHQQIQDAVEFQRMKEAA